jgi:hypothetical protein
VVDEHTRPECRSVKAAHRAVYCVTRGLIVAPFAR